jgi:hypothetical protein
LPAILRLFGSAQCRPGSALAREVRAVDPDQPTYGIRTMDDIVWIATAAGTTPAWQRICLHLRSSGIEPTPALGR